MGEKLDMVDDFKEEVRLENEKKINGNKLGAAITNGKSVALRLECEREKKHSDTWTDSQTAKKAGVGVGTVACYDTVMSCDDERGSNGMDDQYTIR